MKNVAFVGLGYIGLPTAIVMCNAGLNVVGVDVLPEKVDAVNRGELTISEPGLKEELAEAISSGRFHATTDVPEADVYVIAVPTPFTDLHDVDMSFILDAAESIAPKLRGGELIVLESTSPPRTTERLAQRILDLRSDLRLHQDGGETDGAELYFAHCPERILPGQALRELRSNDRIIGGMSQAATKRAKEIYGTFCTGALLETDSTTAELAKLTENSFRDVNIAFANELSMICDELGISVWELIELANHHPRVNILQPGPGVGGHCIAVDPWFIVSTAPDTAKLVRTAREVNDSKPEWVYQKISQAIESQANSVEQTAEVEGTPAVALLGLTFKPNIDDLRQSPALDIAVKTASRHPDHQFIVVEPHITALPDALADLDNVRLGTAQEALDSAETIVLLVNHDEFNDLDTSAFPPDRVIDTRGSWVK